MAGSAATLLTGALVFGLGVAQASAQNIFVKLSSSRTTINSVNLINPPSGYPYSAAAPFSGNYWNVITQSNNCPPGLTAPFDTNLYVNLPLRDSSNNVVSATLTVGYHLAVDTGTRIEPSSANGENALQPGGVMQNAWRNFQTGNFSTWTFSNLTANGRYGLFIYGGTTTSGQSALISNISGSAVIVVTSNVVANSAGVFGSIWTISGGATNLMPQGTTWNFVTGQADANGVFRFIHGFKSDGNFRFMNGFQLVPLSAPGLTGPTNQTIIAGNNATLSASVSGFPTPALQWLENGTNVVGATNATLVLLNVQYSQDAFGYCLIASNEAGIATNCMTLTVIVTPGIANLTNQAAAVGTDITIAPNITGVPTPSLQWQKAGTNLTGETSSTLSVPNAQADDSGQYCLIASNAAGIVTNCMTLTIGSDIAPIITGLTDQTVVEGNTGTFSAAVSGVPLPTLQWQENGVDIPGATGSSLVLTNVQFSQDGFVYSIVASNDFGVASSNATLHVLIPPSITAQPTNLAVVAGNPATFSVTASGVPAVTYQWSKNGSPIGAATNSSYTIVNAQAGNSGTYSVIVSNIAGSTTSSNATLTVFSATLSGTLLPSNGAVNISPDQQLRITFSGDTARLAYTGKKLNVYDAADDSLFATIDTSQFQTYTVDGATVSNAFIRLEQGRYFYYMPIAVYSNQAWITFNPTNRFLYGHTYYVNCDTGLFVDSTGASYQGITGTNAWRFTTKAAGPATPTASTGPTSITVGLDGAGDFATLQGASDWIPQNNTLHRTITMQPGIYHDNTCFLQNRKNVTVTGATTNRNDVQLICASASYAPASSGSGNAATLIVESPDMDFRNFTLDNQVYMTNSLNNSGPFAGRLLVLITVTDRLVFDNMIIKGGQDTYYASGSGYFHNCELWGSVDFIYGPAVLVFDQCTIVEIRSSGGPITAPNTPYAQPYGMNFLNCTFPRALVANGYPYDVGTGNSTFQRAWGQDGYTAIINSSVGSQISTQGWGTFGSGGENTCRARESGTTLIGSTNLISISQRQAAGAYWLNTYDPDYTDPSMSPTNALLAPPTGTNNRVAVIVNPSDYTVAAIFTNAYFTNLTNWMPVSLPVILQSPTNLVVSTGNPASFSVTASGLPVPTYQWWKNGAIIAGQTNATLTIASAQLSDVGNYFVVASNSAGTATSDTATLVLIGVPPVAPTLTATAGVNQVALSWSTSPSASSYNVKRSTTSGGSYVTVTNTTATSLVDTGLVNGTTYYYVVSALNSQGEGANSSEVSATPTCVTPSVPGNPSASVGNAQVTLSWGASTPATSYNIKRSTVNGGPYTTITNVATTSYVDGSVTNGGTYYYVVSGVNTCSESANTLALGVVPQNNSAVYQINSGGPAVSPFAADAYFTGGSTFSTATSINTSGVDNPAPMAVYQTERYNNMSYTFTNLTAGASYTVRLHFAELFWGSTGQRVFNVFINGSEVLTNFDMVALAGSNFKALTRQFTVAANGGGNIIVSYSNVVDNAKSSGIEIIPTMLAPAITSQPTNLTVTVGSTATFNVAATGVPSPSYQWFKDGTNLVGQTSSSLNITNAQLSDAGSYAVIVSSAAGAIASSNATLTVLGTAPTAGFSATPTSGVEPLIVTFTNASSGVPAPSLSWDLGDSSTTNVASFTHSYSAGTYTVSLLASNASGTSTLVSNNLIVVITALQNWQLQNFGCTNCPQAAANADPDGDGQSNSAEFEAGTNPTNSASSFRIISTTRLTTDVVITWSTAGGRTNLVQVTTGNYNTNFNDLSSLIIITGSGDQTTNYTDSGGATNAPSRYYRVRLAP
jgi:pectin methylesterase-like acyl-CoA thioesterase/PKD repeat protein